ncbi:MAG: TraR/DksA family transcriptional regulator [Acidobacteriota bacterium]|nr:TraR/DksA family transcriptional regulator [Blastocatellia bacterium]MDW8412576.1 TraR/DksA family transcriptional regulator [Acidobacteriota bacterium]
MEKAKLEYYKAKLLERRTVLTGMVERTENYGREADTELTQDPADKASNAYTKELLFSQSTNDRFILNLIAEALERIEDGTYGLCVYCNREIQPKRLEAVPWARHCITCQDLQERGLLDEEEQ